MAIYHLEMKIVKRSEGRSAVGSSAYRSATLQHDERTGETFDYRHKAGVVHTKIFAPDHAPGWVYDRSRLWNRVEASEKRRDAQLAREAEIGLPIELSLPQQIRLAEAFVQREFVDRGMIADIGIHIDNPHNPHAHVLLTLRDITPEGFGKKNREWNTTFELKSWRRGLEEVTNEHLAQAGLAIRIDHRSYADQKLDLIPGRKIGLAKTRQQELDLPGFLSDRIAEQTRIMGANGRQILAEPGIALQALTHGQATFTHHDIGRFLNTRTDSAEQFQEAYLKVTTSPELVGLGKDEEGRERYTTREMFALEKGLLTDAETLARRRGHGVNERGLAAMLADPTRTLSVQQRQALEHVTAPGDLKALVGVAGSGKSTSLSAMREVWERDGYTVKGAALSGIAAENLEKSSAIKARTLASYELAWSKGRDPLSPKDILVIDEAGMLGTRQLSRVLEVAERAHSKVVLIGDPEQLQAIEAGAPFRGIAAAHGVANLSEVHRQKTAWHREATAWLATSRTPEALLAYYQNGSIIPVQSRESARTALLARYTFDAKRHPNETRLILAYTREDVKALNATVRALREQNKELGIGQTLSTSQGKQAFAVNDRIRFMRNERSLGVKNGSLGTVEKLDGRVLTVKLDGAQQTLAVDTKFYGHLEHGYAATVHKAQGSTVDRSYVLASPYFDRHTAYVALSRHRESVTLFYAKDDFGGRSGKLEDKEIQQRLFERLSRENRKDLVHDYLEAPAVNAGEAARQPIATRDQERPPAARGQRLEAGSSVEEPRASVAASRDKPKPKTLEEMQRQGRENWLAMRAGQSHDTPKVTLSAQEQERVKRLTSDELREEISRRRPESVERLVEGDAQVKALAQRELALREQTQESQRREREAQSQAVTWREAHAVKAGLHDRGLLSARFLVDREMAAQAARAEGRRAMAGFIAAERDLAELRQQRTAWFTHATEPERSTVAAMQRVLTEKLSRERVIEEFQALAQRRAQRHPETLDRSAEWAATPKNLRAAVDRYNQSPKAVQEKIVETLHERPEAMRAIEQGLKQRHEHVQQLDRGMGLGQ